MIWYETFLVFTPCKTWLVLFVMDCFQLNFSQIVLISTTNLGNFHAQLTFSNIISNSIGNWIFAIALCKWSCSHLSADCNMCIVFLIQGRELFPSKFSVCWHNIAFYQPVYCNPKKLQNREGASNENQDTLTDLTGFCAVFELTVLSLALNKLS